MCGRLAQRRAAEKYLASLGSQHPVRACAHSGHRPIQCRAALARGPAQAGRRRSSMEPGTFVLDALRARLWLSDSALAWPTSSFRLARLPSMPSSGIRWGETWTTRETRVPI